MIIATIAHKLTGMTIRLLFLSLLTGYAHPQPELAIKSSIIKIYSVYADFNYSQPWQKRSQNERSGSGCIIEGKRIITNAHVVSNSTFLQVKRSDQAYKFNPRVQIVAHECDLAMLKVDDESFFE